ncbi:hypothetical protein D9619_004488 [Psilocybe cf. subviscida]|uniref:Uncharacterized protein n=1 Tax=Psilocybe cf. subviscida TaxID=2480587 RepID=A0A8H5BQ60_9AGAR|nr:hypothetical protein D9619_004488 [Psilocybe cf. subviscida]
MADLKARIGPKHDPQAPFTNKVWVSPALANSKQSPLSRARTTNDPHAFRENHTPSPNSGQLSLIDRLDISPDTNEVNENDPVKYGEEGRAKSLLERVQSKKPSKTPLPSPKQSGTNGVNGRHLTPNSTIAETTNSGGRALTKKTQNKQDVTTSTNNVSNGVHEDVCAHASSSLLPYKNDIHSSAQPIPSSPGAAPSGSRDHSSITPSAQSTRQPVAHASQDSLIKRLSPATPAQATLLPQTFQSAPVRETGLVQPNTQLPSGVDEPYHKNSLNQIRDKVLPLIQKNAAARASATAGNIASYIASTPINHTAISDNCVLTFAQRSSEVNRELLARGISTLPPKPTQMPKQFPVGRGADPIRRISKDFTNDKPSSSHIAHSHSRRGSTEDRRMATMSPQLGAYHAQHDSTETSQRLGRSPPPTHWPSTTVEVHRRSRSPSMFHQRNSSGHPPRYDNLPPRHSRQFSTGDPARRHYKSPSRNPERSASPRRRSSFTSRPDYKRSPERHSYRRNDGTRFDMNNNASEGRGHHDGHPRSDSRRAGSFDGRMDEAPLTDIALLEETGKDGRTRLMYADDLPPQDLSITQVQL